MTPIGSLWVKATATGRNSEATATKLMKTLIRVTRVLIREVAVWLDGAC